MEKLDTYLKEMNLTQEKFGEMVSVDQSVVSRFCRGLARPGLKLALKIENVTEGRVPAGAWVNQEAAQ